MMNQNDLVRRLLAKVEMSGTILPDRLAVAQHVIRELAPTIIGIIHEEIVNERRRKQTVERAG